jgi:hypothetical protein
VPHWIASGYDVGAMVPYPSARSTMFFYERVLYFLMFKYAIRII